MKKIVLISFLIISSSIFGQFHTGASRSELGGLIGGMFYVGDLNPYTPYKNTHLAFGVVYRYNIHSRLSFRANFTYGNVSAYDSGSKSELLRNRNLSFHSRIIELAAGVEFNYFPFQLGHDRYKGTAYLLAELGVFHMNPQTDFQGTEVDLQAVGTEGQGTSQNSKGHYSLTQICMPLGVGVKLSLGNRVGLNFEIGIRKTFTDYLDDVKSETYVDPVLLATEGGVLSSELSNRSSELYGRRGDAKTKDWYIFSGAMLTIRLGKPRKCW